MAVVNNMNTNMNSQTVKEIIKKELPALVKNDENIRQFILLLLKEQVKEKTDEIETEIGSRFDRLLEELKKDREQQSKKWEEQNRNWEENQKEIKKLYFSIEKLYHKHETTLGALGSRWGLRSEETFRNALKGILKGLDVEVLNVTEYDDDGEVFGYPEQIELDLIIVNSKLIIAELKSSMSKPDIYAFYKKAVFYQKTHNRKAHHLIVISPMVDKKAREVAKKLEIKIYSYAEDIGEEIAT